MRATRSAAGTRRRTATGRVTATADVTLYAQWSENAPTPAARYTVTLDLNGGEFRRAGQSNELTADAGEAVTLPAASQVTLSNRILSGWNTARNGSGTSYGTGASASFTADTTLYAQWDECPHAHAQPSSSTSFEFVEGSDPHQHAVITKYGEAVCADCGATTGGIENGITQGYSDGSFRPYTPITRQAMATLMYRYMKYANFDVSQKGDLNKFSDRGDVGGYARESME